MDRRPPLAVSPRRLRPRLRSVLGSLQQDQSPPSAKSKPPTAAAKSLIPRPDFRRSTSDLPNIAQDHDLRNSKLKPPTGLPRRATADMLVKEETKIDSDLNMEIALLCPMVGAPAPMFERGRLYDLYSARRNERLRRKHAEMAPESMAYEPSVAVELKKRNVVRKSVPANFAIGRASNVKEMKKPTVPGVVGKAVGDAGRRSVTRSVRRI